VVLHLPRSPTNLRAGNFMIDLALLAPTASTTTNPHTDPQAISDEAQAMLQESSGTSNSGIPDNLAITSVEGVVARARRPTILPYKSWEMDTLRKIMGLPWYALGFRQESETVVVEMLEQVEFARPKTRNLRGALGVPDRVRVVVESREVLEVYSLTVEVRAKLSGLRWMMSRHRVVSFVVGTGLFYAVVMGTVVVVFGGLTIRQVLQEDESVRESKGQRMIKQEAENEDDEETELSDTSRTFPSRRGQEPLNYTGRGRKFDDDETVIKKEEDEEEATLAAASIAPLDADDEDEYEDIDDAGDSFRDSGIGTSVEERNRSGMKRRKRQSGTTGAPAGNGLDGRGRLTDL